MQTQISASVRCRPHTSGLAMSNRFMWAKSGRRTRRASLVPPPRRRGGASVLHPRYGLAGDPPTARPRASHSPLLLPLAPDHAATLATRARAAARARMHLQLARARSPPFSHLHSPPRPKERRHRRRAPRPRTDSSRRRLRRRRFLPIGSRRRPPSQAAARGGGTLGTYSVLTPAAAQTRP